MYTCGECFHIRNFKIFCFLSFLLSLAKQSSSTAKESSPEKSDSESSEAEEISVTKQTKAVKPKVSRHKVCLVSPGGNIKLWQVYQNGIIGSYCN